MKILWLQARISFSLHVGSTFPSWPVEFVKLKKSGVADKCPGGDILNYWVFFTEFTPSNLNLSTPQDFPNNLESWMESDKNFPWVPACEKSAHRILLLRNNSYCSLRQMSAVWYGKHPSRLGHRHLAKNIQRKGFNPRGSMGMVYLPIHEWLVFMIDRLVRNVHSFHGSVMGMNWMMLNLPFVYRKLIICGCFGAPCNEIRKPLGHCGRSILACIQELQKAFLGDCRPLLSQSPGTRWPKSYWKIRKKHCSTSTTPIQPWF